MLRHAQVSLVRMDQMVYLELLDLHSLVNSLIVQIDASTCSQFVHTMAKLF